MTLIFALGNPGKEYRLTRHNFGALALDFHAKVHGLAFTPSKKWSADLAKQGDTLLIKPTSFYNEIGRPISEIISFYKVPLENILIICDDLTLPFGTLRLRPSGTHGGNNGLKSIIDSLGTNQFPRLRLGTASPLRQTLGDTAFVLGRFTPEERQQLPDILLRASQKIQDFTAY